MSRVPLYTSLTQLKQAMNGGTIPPMTPLTPRALKILDPAFTPGLGALEEDPEKGLRCPVRGCGRYFQYLTRHLDGRHRLIGGAAAVRAALDLPHSTALVSRREHDRRVSQPTHRFTTDDRAKSLASRESANRPRKLRRKRSTMQLNWIDRCLAQLSHRLIDLANKLGRSPTGYEFTAEYGHAIFDAVLTTFGSFNNAKALSALPACESGPRRRYTLDSVLPGLDEWYRAHGELPSRHDADRPDRTPLIASGGTVLKVFETDSWNVAMRRAASMLQIRGGRYGLPVLTEQEDAA